jgi:hypothetical protein
MAFFSSTTIYYSLKFISASGMQICKALDNQIFDAKSMKKTFLTVSGFKFERYDLFLFRRRSFF